MFRTRSSPFVGSLCSKSMFATSTTFCSRRWNSTSGGSNEPPKTSTTESTEQQQEQQPQDEQQQEVPKKRRMRIHQKGIDEKRSAFRQGSNSFLAGFSSISLISLGCAFLFVPLYRLFCSPQGKGADPKFIASKARREQEEEEAAHLSDHKKKLIKVRFLGDVGQGMPIKFIPLQREMECLIGEPALAFFSALNMTDRTLTGTSVYSVSPDLLLLYLNKIQCFCFEEQRFRPHELVEMPLFFYFSTDMQSDPLLYGVVDEAILSYTFYNLESTRDIVKGLMIK